MYSYHFFAEFNHKRYAESINSVIIVPFKVISSNSYADLKNLIVKEYDLKIDPFCLVITSLSLLND